MFGIINEKSNIVMINYVYVIYIEWIWVSDGYLILDLLVFLVIVFGLYSRFQGVIFFDIDIQIVYIIFIYVVVEGEVLLVFIGDLNYRVDEVGFYFISLGG